MLCSNRSRAAGFSEPGRTRGTRGLLFINISSTFNTGGLARGQWDLHSRSYRWRKQWMIALVTSGQPLTLRMTSVLKLVVVLTCLCAVVAVCCIYARVSHNIVSITTAPIGNKV